MTQSGLFSAPVVALATYDVILVNSSAGKDSQAMLDSVIEQATRERVLDRVVVVHADLGRVEWKGTRDLAERQAAHYGVRFLVTTRTQNDLLDHIEARRMWPDSQNRYCTSDHKRGPIRRVMTALATEHREAGSSGQTRILNCMGLRRQESPVRAKAASFEHDETASNGRRHVDNWLPIHDWTTEQVWARIDGHGIRHLTHPAYGHGMKRLSCCFCVFAPKAALVIAGQHNPELLDAYVQVEVRIGHRFRHDMAIADVRAAIFAGQSLTDPQAAVHATGCP